jgi:hypothetical protein
MELGKTAFEQTAFGEKARRQLFKAGKTVKFLRRRHGRIALEKNLSHL